MKTCMLFLFLLFSSLITVAQSGTETINSLNGKWVRMTSSGPVGLSFESDGTVEVDFKNDGNVDVLTGYTLSGDTITFTDREGEMCPEAGRYKLECNKCYLAFDLIDDMCNGRVKMTMGFWTRPEFEELLGNLSEKLVQEADPELNLTRARIYLATGNAADARADLDEYIRHNDSSARAYVNRASTRFPADIEGVVSDCNRAIELEPGNKNAWFLRGLARYEMGLKEEACADFSKAIDLGFSILRNAEEQRCSEFWKDEE